MMPSRYSPISTVNSGVVMELNPASAPLLMICSRLEASGCNKSLGLVPKTSAKPVLLRAWKRNACKGSCAAALGMGSSPLVAGRLGHTSTNQVAQGVEPPPSNLERTGKVPDVFHEFTKSHRLATQLFGNDVVKRRPLLNHFENDPCQIDFSEFPILRYRSSPGQSPLDQPKPAPKPPRGHHVLKVHAVGRKLCRVGCPVRPGSVLGYPRPPSRLAHVLMANDGHGKGCVRVPARVFLMRQILKLDQKTAKTRRHGIGRRNRRNQFLTQSSHKSPHGIVYCFATAGRAVTLAYI